MYKESFLMAWASLIANKMRSILTMLGIIIGVAAVIALVSDVYKRQALWGFVLVKFVKAIPSMNSI